jgi:hypothetical protein
LIGDRRAKRATDPRSPNTIETVRACASFGRWFIADSAITVASAD